MSRLPFELLLALRYLRPKRTYVSIITLISIIGVMLGVAVLIIVISVMSGFDKQLRDKILGFNAHLRITTVNSTLRNYPQVASLVASNSQVKGVAPFIVGPVLMETQPDSGSSQVSAPYVRGIDPKAEATVSILPSSIIRGQYDVSGKGLLVGAELADSLKLDVGDVVAIHSPRNLQKMRDSHRKNKNQADREDLFLPDDYVIRGIFDVGYKRDWEVTMTPELVYSYVDGIEDFCPWYDANVSLNKSPFGNAIVPPMLLGDLCMTSILLRTEDGRATTGGMQNFHSTEIVAPCPVGTTVHVHGELTDKFIKKDRRYLRMQYTVKDAKTGKVYLRELRENCIDPK